MFYFDSDADTISNIIKNFDIHNPLHLAIAIVGGLIVILSIWAGIVSIWLGIKYHKYNKTDNSCGQTGEQIARRILDDNGLQNIKVTKNGSIMFGNSYSHYFKRVRLRRLTWQKQSVSSMAMATQKSSLALLDKEGDPDMKKRIALTPISCFGPLAFVPMIIIGVLLDLFVLKSNNFIATIVCTGLGLVFYLIGFFLQLYELKTEKKAQERAYEIARKEHLATEEEIAMMKDLFHLYNIEYVNNLILALLELIWRILMILANVQNSSSNSSSNN